MNANHARRDRAMTEMIRRWNAIPAELRAEIGGAGACPGADLAVLSRWIEDNRFDCRLDWKTRSPFGMWRAIVVPVGRHIEPGVDPTTTGHYWEPVGAIDLAVHGAAERWGLSPPGYAALAAGAGATTEGDES